MSFRTRRTKRTVIKYLTVTCFRSTSCSPNLCADYLLSNYQRKESRYCCGGPTSGCREQGVQPQAASISYAPYSPIGGNAKCTSRPIQYGKFPLQSQGAVFASPVLPGIPVSTSQGNQNSEPVIITMAVPTTWQRREAAFDAVSSSIMLGNYQHPIQSTRTDLPSPNTMQHILGSAEPS